MGPSLIVFWAMATACGYHDRRHWGLNPKEDPAWQRNDPFRFSWQAVANQHSHLGTAVTGKPSDLGGRQSLPAKSWRARPDQQPLKFQGLPTTVPAATNAVCTTSTANASHDWPYWVHRSTRLEPDLQKTSCPLLSQARPLPHSRCSGHLRQGAESMTANGCRSLGSPPLAIQPSGGPISTTLREGRPPALVTVQTAVRRCEWT